VITAYQQERDHWLLSQSAARASRGKGLLNDPRVDVGLAEASVGYRLRQYHLGLVSWVTEGAEHGRGLAQLDRLTTCWPTHSGPGANRCSCRVTKQPGDHVRGDRACGADPG